MTAETSSPGSGQARRVDLKEDYIDPTWKQRWMNSGVRYPEELIDNVGKVRGLFASPDAPSLEDCVFIVCRTNDAESGKVEVVEVYPTVTAANEHVLLLFAKDCRESIDEECSWSMKGAELEQHMLAKAKHATWNFSPHACLSLEIVLDASPSAEPHRVFIVEKWIEAAPPEQLVKRILG